MRNDIFGKYPSMGALIVYGVRSGNSGEMHFGVVFDPENLKIKTLMREYGKWRKGRMTTLSEFTDFVVLPRENKDYMEDEEFANFLQPVIIDALAQ